MGFISRNVFPACESMCICCPALRSRSRQPVKRYKKLLGEIFPKSPDGAPNERKIVKLCEYAAKNPIRIPKIAKFLEERCYKDLRSEQMKFINIVTEAYNKMLCHCKDQMAYFATSLLNVVTELLENSKLDTPTILGCQTLTRFIYSQVDGTYTHSIEKFALKVCALAREEGDEHQKLCLRASGLQCLSAMVWFMGEFSHIFAAVDEIVHATLDNYEANMIVQTNEDREEQNCNWVNEVIRCEGRGTAVCNSPSYMIVRPRTARKDPTLLTKEETEMPKVWAQICLQRMVDLAKESTTLRQILDPMFSYFNSRRQWTPPNGLAMIVLSDAVYLMETSGSQQLVLSTVVRHLDNKHVANDPELKAYIIQVAGCLAKLIRTSSYLRDISFVNDLCRHLRKSFQATARSIGDEELNLNVMLQNSIEDCLREIAKGIVNTQHLFDMMAVSVEGLPSSGIVSRAAVGSLLILAHAMSSALSPSMRSQQVFPDGLLDALLKAMLHPNVETRVGAHEIFSVILLQSSGQSQAGLASVRASGYLNELRNWRSDTTSAFTSITARLDKLRKEKDGAKIEKNGYNNNTHEDLKNYKSSPNFHKLNSIIDRTAGFINLADMLPSMMKFTEDQIGQLLSAFWIQSTLPDILPSNIEAIAHSISLMLLSLRLKNPDDGLVVRAFQLLFSLRNLSLELNNGSLPTVCKRLILALSTSTLMFAAKIYQIPHICEMLKTQVPGDVDPYLFIGDDLQLHVRTQANMKDFGSSGDSQMATSMLFEIRSKVELSNTIITDIVAKNLHKISKLEEADVKMQLLESFTPDDAFMFGSRPNVEPQPNQSVSKESLSFDEDIPAGSMAEDEVTSELSVRFPPRGSPSPSIPQVISIGQLMESALEVAGQVVVSSVSTSPLPYDTMTNRCETFGTGTRQKLSRWLATENRQMNGLYRNSPEESYALEKVVEDGNIYGRESGVLQDSWSMMRLPPASPFDNFLKAAGAGR
ncbi:PREDICTED: protein EFR3 homolog B-like isoform X2 [Camelina sativa]|uniref:Protein EFR3 homolog B-like isoform X2 n=1 Tax=Camelina sativa TaxID=90675 RepID=A0ABM0Y199_CAMSA|nr:PREDICTED: protein EFR3 homolog B-like isoform X2 [Camelina sativa]